MPETSGVTITDSLQHGISPGICGNKFVLYLTAAIILTQIYDKMGGIQGAREVPWKPLHLLGAFPQASCLVNCIVLPIFLHRLKIAHTMSPPK